MPEDQSQDTRKFLSTAFERFRRCVDAEAGNRKDALDDLKFSLGEQWPAEIQTQRSADGRPCLVMNQSGKFIKQVCNEQRQQRPAIQVNPVGDGADKETADVIQGMCRHIEVNSDAEIAYDEAFEFMVRTGGPGWWRIITDYIDDSSDNQEIRIEPVHNHFTVYDDPMAVKPCHEDSKFRFIVEDLDNEDFRDQYPDSAISKLSNFQSVGDAPPGWLSKESVRIAEYFEVKTRKEGKRTKSSVHWYKINALEIMEEREWPGKYIPLVPVFGTVTYADGKKHIAGIIRDLKDPQRQYNYMCSAATESVALAPKAPFILDPRQIEGHEEKWSQANTRNMAFLPYKAIPNVEMPQRSAVEPPIQAQMLLLRQAGEDLNSTTGLYNPSLGKQESAQESGKAVLARQKQGDVVTLNYSDNLARSIRHTGRILIDLMPHIYDAPRVQRIIKPDTETEHVGVFNSDVQQMSPDEAQTSLGDAAEKAGIQKMFDLGVGTYDVTVSVGPSYQSKRQEAAAMQLELMREVPVVQNAAPDLVIRNMDMPGADAIADRVKRTLPPQLLDEDGNDPQSQLQKVQAQLNQITQQYQQASQLLQQQHDIIQGKKMENEGKFNIAQLEQSTKLRMFQLGEETKIVVAQIQTKAQDAIERAKQSTQEWAELHGAAHETALSQQEHGQQMQQLKQQAQNASLQSAQEAGQNSMQSAQDAAQSAMQPQGAD